MQSSVNSSRTQPRTFLRPTLFLFIGLCVLVLCAVGAYGVFLRGEEGNQSALFQPSRPSALAERLLPDGFLALLYKIRTSQVVYKKDAAPSTGRNEKIIRINLASMQLSLYEGETEAKTFSVQAKGKPGSPWETPAGTYAVLTKEEKHFSSLGRVWMPWSMQFFGNFFIHGWPYYPDGREVEGDYSGGCIRLSTEDAREVFAFADLGTVIVVETGMDTEYPPILDTDREMPAYYLRKIEPFPVLAAEGYLVGDLERNEVIFARNQNAAYPIRGITKFMTALVSLEALNQFQTVTVPGSALADREPWISNTATVLVKDLIEPLLLGSNNIAAFSLAKIVGADTFVLYMNMRARALGLFDTAFADPAGISSRNVSTARDLFAFARHVRSGKRYLFSATVPAKDSFPDFSGSYMGGVVARGKGMQSALVTFTFPISEFEKRELAIIILESGDIDTDIRSATSFIERNLYYGMGGERRSLEKIGDGHGLFQAIYSITTPIIGGRMPRSGRAL